MNDMPWRPEEEWDIKFLLAAKHFGSWSKCLSRQIGAILVRDKTVISSGYNGPPRGVPHCNDYKRKEELERIITLRKDIPYSVIQTIMKSNKCPRKCIDEHSGTFIDLCPAGHAERNAISNAAREGVITKGADLYCYCPLPCFECAKSIINSGIKSIVCLDGNYDNTAFWLLDSAGIKMKHYYPHQIKKYEEKQNQT
jgi:dCMP deaminase